MAAEDHDDDLELTPEEEGALLGINNAPALGQTTATEPDISQRMLDHGLVTKDETGHLVLTAKGKRLLRAGS